MAKVKTKAAANKAVKPAKPAKATKSAKPPKSTKVTRPADLPPPPPPPPAVRDELAAPRDVARLIRYGEQFGPNRIDVRMWNAPTTTVPAQLPITSGSIAMFDPTDKKSWKVFDRPTGTGQFRIMLSMLKAPNNDAAKDKVAAIVIHTGRPPIARWTVAHWKGQKKPKSADELPRIASTGWIALMDANGGSPGVLAVPPASNQPVEVALTDGRRALAIPSGKGEFAAYWAVDAHDKPICFVIDFDAISQKDWRAKPT
ncbi:MAG: DUF4241 domain-containing protein [Kofleriaceae bacterium]